MAVNVCWAAIVVKITAALVFCTTPGLFVAAVAGAFVWGCIGLTLYAEELERRNVWRPVDPSYFYE